MRPEQLVSGSATIAVAECSGNWVDHIIKHCKFVDVIHLLIVCVALVWLVTSKIRRNATRTGLNIEQAQKRPRNKPFGTARWLKIIAKEVRINLYQRREPSLVDPPHKKMSMTCKNCLKAWPSAVLQ
jgi:hypothetical protein